MALISQGQLAGLDGKGTGPARPVSVGGGLSLWGGRNSTPEELWRTQPHLRTVVDFLARSVSQIGLQAFERKAAGDRRRLDPSEPLGAWVQEPSPRMGMISLLDRLVHDLAIWDRFCAIKVRDRFDRIWLQPVPAKMWTPLATDWTGLAGVKIGRDKILTPDQVVAFWGYSPESLATGTSPIESLKQLLAGHEAAEIARESFWTTGAQVRGVIERPLDAPPISDEGLQRLRHDWDGRYSGPTSAGRTPLLEDGMTFRPVTVDAKSSQYLETRKLTREEVAAAYFVPAPFVGVLDHATFSNVVEQHKQLYQDTLGPWLRRIEQEFERQLVRPDFSPEQYLDFNEAERLRGTLEERAAVISTAVGGPWLTRNEARSMENRPPVDGGDELITPMNVTAGGQASPQSGKAGPLHTKSIGTKADPAPEPVRVAADPDLSDTLTEAMTAHAERFAQWAASKRGAKADASADTKRWVSELVADIGDTIQEIGATAAAPIAAEFGLKGWDPVILAAYLTERTKGAAESLQLALEDIVDGLDGDATGADTINAVDGHDTAGFAGAVAVGVAMWAAVDTASRGDGAVKSWSVTSANPRASHAAMAGETVPLDSSFSIGLRWPRDADGSADETCGCTCEMDITRSSP